ncbi:MAG: nicotinate phosphoribosyltransferase [Gammaproteobacteria bacterium]|nr:nicotinate phosphoribosyltransferase [Gammaproteobacteria bacterium]
MISPLLTDLYQLTMAYGYWRLNMHERESVFHLVFRNNPFQGNYTVACGLATVIEFIQQWKITSEDIEYLKSLKNADGSELFSIEFLTYLAEMKITCNIDAIPEGTVVFPQEPLLRVQGPLLQCQLLETALLNIVNFQTLIATKAARICQAVGEGDEVLEFGLRRAQGPDGALSASRAAYIGGCAATSNVLAGKLYDIPVRGTHAHNWVTAFADEKTAFAAYAEVMPQNCVLLVDTYDTLKGIENAISIGQQLRLQGAELLGVRLDSGDLAKLSIQARSILDAAGFTETRIVASNTLDEYSIASLRTQGAPITVWGVGTHLVTAYDEPALDGVYKLSALRELDGRWEYKLKLSEQSLKISNPGIYQVRRFFSKGQPVMDILYDIEIGISDSPQAQTYKQPTENISISGYDASQDLLVPVLVQGRVIYSAESIHLIRQRAVSQVAQFRKFYSEQSYAVGLEKDLFDLKHKLIKELKSPNL